MSEDSFMQYDEAEAVKFIRNYMPEDIRDRYDDDEILNIIDMIWDFYEEQGYAYSSLCEENAFQRQVGRCRHRRRALYSGRRTRI